MQTATTNSMSCADMIGPLVLEHAVRSRILMLDSPGRTVHESYIELRNNLQILSKLYMFAELRINKGSLSPGAIIATLQLSEIH